MKKKPAKKDAKAKRALKKVDNNLRRKQKLMRRREEEAAHAKKVFALNCTASVLEVENNV